ncbi:hypothetical protein [Cedecea davisae]|uniref:hypothetical protein n=1 Tax=Cedecea davisae TaxID=158484 RepID=UPI00242F00D9|nr:hypothetical protein [Cedecea davisae]
MNKLILTIMLLMGSTFAFANGHPLAQTCSAESGKLITDRTVQNFNVTRTGYVNYRLSGEGDVWYFLHVEDPYIQGESFLYDFLKVAYLTGAKVDVCLFTDGNTLGMERTNGANY